jgi:SAM-dependent methyltransferase
VHDSDIAVTTAIEGRHWWYRERRSIIAREARRVARRRVPRERSERQQSGPGRAIEIGAAGGGNSLVLARLGWDVLATEYLAEGVAIARSRGLRAVRADARCLPAASGAFDLLVAFDVLEHIEEDHLAAAEIRRVLRPGGTALCAVPCDMALWSAHDEASGHFRRYDRAGLAALIGRAGLVIDAMWSWNVLLRPAVALARRFSTGSDMTDVHPVVNAALRAVVAAERHLPVRSLPGVSLMVRARRPDHVA